MPDYLAHKKTPTRLRGAQRHATIRCMGELIDGKISMITDKDHLRGLLFYWDLGLSPAFSFGEPTVRA